ncbi:MULTISPECIES: dihydroorotate dehydrogenase electron transfer subunit [unclassified Streptococcus]|uniref:dihydroorotate dehydrogenase electron transfer subunit n=1 Tax=unclassified Streptococcus TaxID=2608887 RepID=UPI0010715E59|nr:MULTISPECIES: dihydroorotate dehydrogenase electron transfer subunit [unclassified Streptococcus]MBF0786629.1 dihydroorotate dehydrogenase electron transfer subunit [Streptococcus sp. 19428wC2_LYSM12]MCQ9212806.1 dihydroorotate dehydrogenase electron transfer subunit [Streptococcus sp. B01]MCQ9214147.1 dihydroorotate dehydrogenase electron transfer subunit [Streptococcus sp. O1]TFV06588.1 dihydroorotate dehydrogenase electron transfer subunit [Streptococcus sp. LYSM12]
MILKEMMTVVRQDCLAPNIFSLILKGQMVAEMRPGQFLHLKVPDKSMTLRRPISISEINVEKNEVRLIYRIEGQGTAIFSKMQVGDRIDVMGPLGNGFPLEHLEAGQTILVIGGGIGVPPLVELAKQAYIQGIKVVSVIGFADRHAVILEEELQRYGEVFVTTDNGSYGQQGYVSAVVDGLSESFDAVYACGAPAMMAYVDKQFEEHPHAYLSLEARMACGMGACYACVVRPKEGQEHENKRVCKEGPVFATGSLNL